MPHPAERVGRLVGQCDFAKITVAMAHSNDRVNHHFAMIILVSCCAALYSHVGPGRDVLTDIRSQLTEYNGPQVTNKRIARSAIRHAKARFQTALLDCLAGLGASHGSAIIGLRRYNE